MCTTKLEAVTNLNEIHGAVAMVVETEVVEVQRNCTIRWCRYRCPTFTDIFMDYPTLLASVIAIARRRGDIEHEFPWFWQMICR